jgi:hypothetical protein
MTSSVNREANGEPLSQSYYSRGQEMELDIEEARSIY